MLRRTFLQATAAPPLAVSASKKVAAIVNTYYPLSHADVIVGRFLDGYAPNGVRVEPRCRIVSMYTAQIASGRRKDMSRDLASKHGFTIYPTVAEALTLGGDRLAVDAVLLIGEHGDYPVNEKKQKLYPRFERFQEIVEVYRASKRSVPTFSDKHLSWSWPSAKRMYDEARSLKIPFMAGSSVYVSGRTPELTLPLNAPLECAVGVGYPAGNNWNGEGLESYGFHALEAFQCMVERRAGGEKGIAAVETLMGDAVWKWRDSQRGRWSAPLLNAALQCAAKPIPAPAPQAAVFLLEYRDGFRAAVYMLEEAGNLFAAQWKGRAEPVATRFGYPEGKGRRLAHFDGLVHCIEELFLTGKSPRPIERTLLVTGALAALLDSKYHGRRMETPELAIAYRAPKSDYFQHT